MRTTLDIEDDVLQAAKELARHEGSTAGRVISDLARRGLNGSATDSKGKFIYKNGIRILAPRGEIVTHEHVRKLMDQMDEEDLEYAKSPRR